MRNNGLITKGQQQCSYMSTRPDSIFVAQWLMKIKISKMNIAVVLLMILMIVIIAATGNFSRILKSSVVSSPAAKIQIKGLDKSPTFDSSSSYQQLPIKALVVLKDS